MNNISILATIFKLKNKHYEKNYSFYDCFFNGSIDELSDYRKF